MIDEYNGKTDPQPVTSLSDRMLIHFTSNDAIRFSGFELEYLEYRKQSKIEYHLVMKIAWLHCKKL